MSAVHHYARLDGGGEAYQFEAGKSYTGTLKVTKLAEGIEVSGALSADGQEVSHFSTVDQGSEANNFGMLALHVNRKTFGSPKAPDTPDNGIDFINVRVEVLAE
ncbi:hypothetical protein KMP13_06055 [Epibacterium ulvae]|uniref:hypothetical protein n=1 Tax=Epibacterium ulvae TaxID=1156985 RepID=UPI001BFC723F|nr:hypothetical protein [Epibacterium ulvae]MBT8153464.1 hypothetical protein [Epibacterium ulvae]